MSQSENVKRAYELFESGTKPSFSTLIDEVTITAGYGNLDSVGNFEFPLSVNQENWEIIPLPKLSTREILENFIKEAQEKNWCIPPLHEIQFSNHYWLKYDPRKSGSGDNPSFMVAMWNPVGRTWHYSDTVATNAPAIDVWNWEVIERIPHPNEKLFSKT